jgi:alpha-1,3-rhamnosyl/mannosyltransferase
MSNIRVSVDSTPLLVRSAGVKTYLWHWTEALRRAAGPRRLTRFPFLDHPRDFAHERAMVSPPGAWLRLALVHSANLTRGLSTAWMAHRCDIFHASHFTLYPPRVPRLTATIYDMTCWVAPETHSAANARAVRRFAEQVIKRAHGLVAISRHTREDALKILGLAPEKVHVIYPGVPDAYFDATPPPPSPRPYVLFVGTIEPRKNVGVLLDAWERTPPEFDLVVAGSAGWGDGAAQRRLASPPARVRYLGYVPEPGLPALTRGATALVYPSLYEGFGLPVAQALAAGVPVVTSHTSSLPEVAGPGGLLVDPRSASDLAAALNRLLEDPDLRRRLSAAGREHASEFRWDRCARLSWEFFEKVAQ